MLMNPDDVKNSWFLEIKTDHVFQGPSPLFHPSFQHKAVICDWFMIQAKTLEIISLRRFLATSVCCKALAVWQSSFSRNSMNLLMWLSLCRNVVGRDGQMACFLCKIWFYIIVLSFVFFQQLELVWYHFNFPKTVNLLLSAHVCVKANWVHRRIQYIFNNNTGRTKIFSIKSKIQLGRTNKGKKETKPWLTRCFRLWVISLVQLAQGGSFSGNSAQIFWPSLAFCGPQRTRSGEGERGETAVWRK